MTSRGCPLVLGAAALLLVVAVLGTLAAARWVGQPFPGFLLLENRVVASVGLSHWPATAGGAIYQHEVIAVEGAALESAQALYRRVRNLPAGAPLTYTLRRGDRTFERTIPTQTFELADFALLFGVYLINGLVMGATALVLCLRRSPATRASVPLLLIGALWGLSALDLYAPHHLFRLHALCEALLFPAALHMALAFPEPLRFAHARSAVWLPYGLAAAFALVYQAGLPTPELYVWVHLVATSALGVALLVLLVSLVGRYLRPASLQMRRQLRPLAFGALAALALPVCLTLAELQTGGLMPQNAIGLTAFVLPLSVGYATFRS